MRIIRFVWRQPLWLLRSIVVVGGLLGGGFIALAIVAAYIDPLPAAEVALLNQTRKDAVVVFNPVPVMVLAPGQNSTLTSARPGSKRMDVVAGAFLVILEFEAPRYGVDFELKIVEMGGSLPESSPDR